MPTICVQPLSSPYALLPRTHTYTLLLALLLPLPQGWLSRAALAAFTTRTATFAIDAFVLYHNNDNRGGPLVLPLDVLPAAEALALACLAALWMLTVSKRVRNSSARGLVRWWGLLVGCGAVVAFVTVSRLPRTVGLEGSCPVGEVGMDAGDLLGGNVDYFTARVGVPGVVAASLAFLSFLAPRMAFAQGGWEVGRDEGGFWGAVRGVVEFLITLGVPGVSIWVIYSAERYIYGLAGGLPSAEGMDSVGQWGVWAATGIVVVGTAMGYVLKEMGFMEDGLKGREGESAQQKDEGDEIIRVV